MVRDDGDGRSRGRRRSRRRMVKSEFEIAVRLTWDPTKPTSPVDRVLISRALELAREVQRVRGVSDPALDVVAQHLAELPVAESTTPSVSSLPPQLAAHVQDAEQRAIRDALGVTRSISHAARMLGISRKTLTERLRSFNIELPVHFR